MRRRVWWAFTWVVLGGWGTCTGRSPVLGDVVYHVAGAWWLRGATVGPAGLGQSGLARYPETARGFGDDGQTAPGVGWALNG